MARRARRTDVTDRSRADAISANRRMVCHFIHSPSRTDAVSAMAVDRAESRAVLHAEGSVAHWVCNTNAPMKQRLTVSGLLWLEWRRFRAVALQQCRVSFNLTHACQ